MVEAVALIVIEVVTYPTNSVEKGSMSRSIDRGRNLADIAVAMGSSES